MPASTNPSGLLAESLAALSKSAYQVFAEVESQAQRDVAQATADAREARLERDRALETLHAAQLEGQEWQKEVASVKAVLKQAEISISHQKETIAQLRREATQWKDQSRNWQEHFLRVEQERCSLTTRIEELVAERLQWSHPLAPPFAPSQPTITMVDAISSPSTKPPSSASLGRPPAYKSTHPLSPPDVDSPPLSISAHKPGRATTKPFKVSKNNDPSPTRPFPAYEASNTHQWADSRLPQTHNASRRSPARHKSRSTVVRRVQAVINVKQEQSDGESGNLERDDGRTHENTIITNSKWPLRRTRDVVPDDEESMSGNESDQAPMSSDYDDEQGNADDDDDELMLGAEENRHGQYNTRTKSSKNTSHSEESLPSSPSKKRKLAGPAGREKPPARRKA